MIMIRMRRMIRTTIRIPIQQDDFVSTEVHKCEKKVSKECDFNLFRNPIHTWLSNPYLRCL